MSTEINYSRSLSGFVLNNTINKTLPDDKEVGIKRYAKLALSSTLLGLGALALLVEGVARAVIALTVKLFTFLIPHQYAKIPDQGIAFFAESAVNNIKNMLKSGYLTAAILTEPDFNHIQKIESAFENETVEATIQAFSTIHINGFIESQALLRGLEGAVNTDIVTPIGGE